MNKSKVFEYILELEDGIKLLLDDNPIKDVLVFEIINGALVYVHELDASSLSDEMTARWIMKLVINSLFNEKKLLNVFTKHVNGYNTFGRNGTMYLVHNIDKEAKYVNTIVKNEDDLSDLAKSLCNYVNDFKFTKQRSKDKNIIHNMLHHKTMIVSIIAVVIVVSISVVCYTKQSNNHVGKFVYVDWFNTIHIDRNCASSMIEMAKTKDERMIRMHGVDYIDTCAILFSSYDNHRRWYGCNYTFCPRCVSDMAYKSINRMMDRNTSRQTDISEYN